MKTGCGHCGAYLEINVGVYASDIRDAVEIFWTNHPDMCGCDLEGGHAKAIAKAIIDGAEAAGLRPGPETPAPPVDETEPQDIPAEPPPDKLCKTCGQTKPGDLEHFPPHRNSGDGLMGRCRDCCVAGAAKARAAANASRPSQSPEDVKPEGPNLANGDAGKVCTGCGEWKPVDQLTPHRGAKHGVIARCRECQRKSTSKGGKASHNGDRRETGEVASARQGKAGAAPTITVERGDLDLEDHPHGRIYVTCSACGSVSDGSAQGAGDVAEEARGHAWIAQGRHETCGGKLTAVWDAPDTGRAAPKMRQEFPA